MSQSGANECVTSRSTRGFVTGRVLHPRSVYRNFSTNVKNSLQVSVDPSPKVVPMKRATILAIVLSPLLFVAACSGAPAPSGSSAPPIDQLTVLTPPGKGPVANVNWNLGDGEPASLDPSITWSGSQNFVGVNLCESLLSVAPDGSIQSGLATDVAQKDPTTLVATLRSGATFWDGTPVTAQDAAFSLDRARTDPASQYAGDLKSISSITATDASTLTIKLSRPDVLIRANLATSASAVYSKSYFEATRQRSASQVGR